VRLSNMVCADERLVPTDALKETWFGLNASLTYICEQARHGRCLIVSDSVVKFLDDSKTFCCQTLT